MKEKKKPASPFSRFFKDILNFVKNHPIITSQIVIGSLLILSIVVLDGMYGCVKDTCGFLIGNNFKDKLQHLAVSGTSFQTIPFNSAIMSDVPLQGYHYLPNLIIYLLTFLGIPTTFSFFHLLPILYVILFPILAVRFARGMGASWLVVGFFLFFSYFGSTFSYLTSLRDTGSIFQDAIMVPLMDGTQVMRSIHYGISLLILLAILILYQKKEVRLSDRILAALLLFISVGSKFYGAVLTGFAVGLFELYLLYRDRNWKSFGISMALYAFVSVVGVFIFYNPLSASENGSSFIYAPFAIVHHILEDPKIFYNEEQLLARYTLQEAGGFSPRLLLIELITTVLFTMYYAGTRILGFGTMVLNAIRRKGSVHDWVLTILVTLSLVLSVSFIQKGDWFNTIQFYSYGTFILGWFAATGIAYWFEEKKVGKMKPLLIAVVGVVLLLTLVPNLRRFFYFNEARFVIPQQEYEALKFLKQEPFGAMYVTPLIVDGSYHTAIAQKPVYYYTSYENVYANWGIDYNARAQKAFPGSINVQEIPVTYFYVLKNHPDGIALKSSLQKNPQAVELLFENAAVEIYKMQ